MNCFAEVKYIAKRQHRRNCCICGEPIRKGDEAKRWTCEDGGDLSRAVAHQPCLDIVHRQERGAFEWFGHYFFEDSPEGVAECVAAVAKARSAVSS